MDQNFEYYAFISYKREDEKWAKWLQDQLRWYKLPSSICKQFARLPKRIWPIFRDNTDLNGGKLEENIRKELECSQYLIVICSPEAARSPWVGKEVEYFASLNRTDKIIPFVVSGIPYSNNPETECIHERIKAVSKEELLAINIKEEGIGTFAMKKKRAFIRVVARLLDIKFNSLWQPYERVLKTRKWCIKVAIVILLFSMFALWDYSRIKYEYFADYVDRWGLPEGIIELKKELIKKRYCHYRFEYTHQSFLKSGKGTLKRVVLANSAGYPIEHSLSEYIYRPSIQQIEIRKDKRGQQIIEIEYQNSKQKPLIIANIAGDSLQYVDLKSLDKGMDITITSSFSSITPNAFENIFQSSKSEIRRYRLIRNEKGFITKKLFKKYNGNDGIPACDAKGIYGLDYTLDSIGRSKWIKFIGFEGNNFPNNIGVAFKRYEYDINGNISNISYLNIKREPVLNEQKWATYIRTCDNNGNIVTGVYLGIDQKPCYSDGAHRISKKYDGHGNCIEEAYYDIEGKPTCVHKDGIAKRLAKFDKLGNIIETVNYDIDGMVCLNKNGYAKLVTKYDEQSNLIEAAYYGTDNKLCLNKNRIAKWTADYDKYGNMIEITFFDANGKYVRNELGIIRAKSSYNSKGYLSSIIYTDEHGNLSPNKIGIAQILIFYDNNNNKDKISFWDADGAPYPIANVTAKYDESGNQTEEFYLILENKFVQCEGFNWKAKYDNGNLIEKTYLDNEKKAYLNPKEGYAKYVAKYDDQGKIIEVLFFDTEGTPCYNKNGYARVSYEYDKQGNAIKGTFFDTEGNLHPDIHGIAMFTARYDDQSNKIEEASYNAEKKPSLNAKGAAKMTAECNIRGEITKMSYWGTNGKLCLNNEKIAVMTYKYDEKGNLIEIAYYDTNEKPCLHQDGYSKLLEMYDERGYCTELAYMNTENKLCLQKDGFAKLRCEYDDRGNIVKQIFFDINDQPCMNNYGFAAITQKYDERSLVIEKAYFDTQNKPYLVNGYFKETTKYDELLRPIEKAFFDTENKPCLGNYDFAKITIEFDKKGNYICKSFDKENNLMNKKQFDEYGNCIDN